jgi:hypothetical protein
VDISYLPERLLSLAHFLHERSISANDDLAPYYIAKERMAVLLNLTRVIGLLTAALVLWIKGPTLELFFLPPREELPAPASSTDTRL